MRAVVDADVCIGCTLCVQTCPEVYHMEADKAVAISGDVGQNVQETCRKAADECPVEAITIQE